ncbi:hypothetical protein GXN76_11235 [Kroppenstedtia pulmonis]|uniref:Uncharacterized protein n=1 Tax=Kroppenstedtia pulmonis TaxID=1380685 RepID=A0A7D3XSD3_9BACL|nr:hypothetical protein [Kroppenstedtia pulmonis]QKG84988.1 hypothetical protein GXN76_11235 [Kroppenstedtia pulmonis]
MKKTPVSLITSLLLAAIFLLISRSVPIFLFGILYTLPVSLLYGQPVSLLIDHTTRSLQRIRIPVALFLHLVGGWLLVLVYTIQDWDFLIHAPNRYFEYFKSGYLTIGFASLLYGVINECWRRFRCASLSSHD